MSVIKIPLIGVNGIGKFALVDDDDYGLVSGIRWAGHSKGYACDSNGGRGMMHNVIMGIAKPDRKNPVDHLNGNKLDNRRDNLKVRTKSEDLRNRRAYQRGDKSTGHKFVVLGPMRISGQTWIAVPPRRLNVAQQTFYSLEEAINYVALATEREILI